jgi:hypothetical protein
MFPHKVIRRTNWGLGLGVSMGLAVVAACSSTPTDSSCLSYTCSNTTAVGTTAKPPQGSAEELRSQAEILFRGLEADFKKSCAGGCHDTAVKAALAPTFLAGPDAYIKIKANTKIVLSDYPSSAILTIGQHSGPPLDGLPDLSAKIVTWLRYEAAAISSDVAPSTETVTIASGPVSFSLAGLDKTGVLKDAKITGVASITGSLLSISDLKLIAPSGVKGVHLAQPRFMLVRGDKTAIPDVADNFSNVDITAGAGLSIALGPAPSAVFTGWQWATGDKLRIEAKKLENSAPSIAGKAPECKNSAMFKTTVMPLFLGVNTGRNCAATNCHGAAQKSPDMSIVNGKAPGVVNDADAATFCASLLNYVNKANPAQSAVILKAAGATPHNGQKVSNPDAFTTAVTDAANGIFY